MKPPAHDARLLQSWKEYNAFSLCDNVQTSAYTISRVNELQKMQAKNIITRLF